MLNEKELSNLCVELENKYDLPFTLYYEQAELFVDIGEYVTHYECINLESIHRDIEYVLYYDNLIMRKSYYRHEKLYEGPYDTNTFISWKIFTRPFFEYKHKLISSLPLTPIENDIIAVWLHENLQEGTYSHSRGIIGFESDTDMALFLLQWDYCIIK